MVGWIRDYGKLSILRVAGGGHGDDGTFDQISLETLIVVLFETYLQVDHMIWIRTSNARPSWRWWMRFFQRGA
jgi:hypothetical protein